ncbi:MAG: DHHA1 domain-containing protein, partial [Bdellovibrionales bacterium]|nr:DHHA1 domain-containing protein [Bdellovibrionales bacterium]
MKTDQSCQMKVNKDHRRLIAAGHSATHLLHQALREELGASVHQAGSLVSPGELRFDFTFPKPLTEDQIGKIEKRVRKNIQSKNPVSDASYSYEEAVQTGALFLKGENYSSRVRVITMGDSREFCGGIHVKNTADIGSFKITSETGVQSGVRRITALVNEKADKWLDFFIHQNFDLRKYLHSFFSGSQRGEASLSGNKAQNLSGNKQPSHLTKNLSAEGNISIDVKIDMGREKINPFISWMKTQDEKIKQLKNQLKNLIPPEKSMDKEDQSETFQSSGSFQLFLEEGESSIDYEEWIKKHAQSRDFLVEQILEFRKHLKSSVLKDIESSSQDTEKMKTIIKDKRGEVQALEDQLAKFPWEELAEKNLKKQVRFFHFEEVKGGLLIMALPITDRKILSDMADQLKLKISSGVVVLLGEGQESWPLMVAVTKDLQKYISAGELMKNTIIPLLGGKGGGQARFAQGVITDKKHFSGLEKTLLQVLNPTLDEKKQTREIKIFLRDVFVFPFRVLWFKNLVIRKSL